MQTISVLAAVAIVVICVLVFGRRWSGERRYRAELETMGFRPHSGDLETLVERLRSATLPTRTKHSLRIDRALELESSEGSILHLRATHGHGKSKARTFEFLIECRPLVEGGPPLAIFILKSGSTAARELLLAALSARYAAGRIPVPKDLESTGVVAILAAQPGRIEDLLSSDELGLVARAGEAGFAQLRLGARDAAFSAADGEFDATAQLEVVRAWRRASAGRSAASPAR